MHIFYALILYAYIFYAQNLHSSECSQPYFNKQLIVV